MISVRCHTKQQQGICCCSEGNVKRHPEHERRICCCVEERDSDGKNRDWVSLLVYKEVAGEAGRRILAWGNDAKESNEDSFSAPRSE